MTGARVRRAATLAMVSLALISSLLLLVLQGSAGASPAPGAEAMSIDMDTTGNTATALGPRDNCVAVSPGATLNLDVTVTNIPASNPMIAFGFLLGYDPAVVSVQSADPAFLLTANPGSQLFDASETLPDRDGAWNAGVADIGSGIAESGSGVLDRVTLSVLPSAPAGVYPLYLSDAAYVDSMNNAIPPGALNSAFVAVNAGCDTLPTPTATPMSTPTPVISPPVLPTPPQTTPATPAPPGTPVPVPGSDVLIGIDHDGPPPDINPGSLVLPVGGAGSISVVAETGGTPVGAAELDVKYDPNLIHATGCSVAFGVCNSAFSDHVRIAMATVAGVSGVAKIADIDFQAVPQASGCSAVTVDVIAVGDVAGDPLTVSAVSGTICVGSTPTPAPTPTVPPPGTPPPSPHPTVSPIDRTPGPTPIEGAPPPFEPGNTTCIENFETPANCDGNTSPGANPDLRTKPCVGWGPDCDQAPNIPSVKDSSFDTLISFTPVEFLPGTINAPIGAFSGRINITADFGLLNNPCNSSIDLGFTLLEGSINTGDLIDPRPVGSTDVFKPLAVDGNGNGMPDGAERYPSFLNRLFANAQPVRRLFGTAHVQGSWMTWNIVYFAPGSHIFVGNDEMTFDDSLGVPAILIFNDPTAPPLLGAVTDMCAPLLIDMITLGRTIDNPCTPVAVAGANCPISPAGGSQIDNRGYPFFPCETGNSADEDGDGEINDGCPQTGPISEAAIPGACDNNISDDTEDSDMNDGCPVVGGQSEGDRMPGACSGSDEGGCVALVNPEAGMYGFTTYVSSRRDADGDGIENSLDVCFADPNPDWNPRVYDQATDTDGDGLPNACDPGGIEPGMPYIPPCDSGYTGSDFDRDCYSNRADNCPLVNQLVGDKPVLTDSDGDGIGDACDPNPDAPNGSSTSYCLEAQLAIGGPATIEPATSSVGSNCALAQTVQTPIVAPLPRSDDDPPVITAEPRPTPTRPLRPVALAGAAADPGSANNAGLQPAALPRTGGGSTGGGSLAGLVLLGGALVVGGAALSARRGGRRHRRP